MDNNEFSINKEGKCKYLIASNSKSECYLCQSNYYLLNNECRISSYEGCIKMNEQNECIECSNGYFNKHGICQECSSHCTSCDRNECFQCSNGYSLINGECTTITSDDKCLKYNEYGCDRCN